MRIVYDSKHAARVALGVAHARRNKSLASRCNDLVLLSKDKYHISMHHVFGHAGNAGNDCADIAASFGTNGFTSECNVPSFWPSRHFSCKVFLNVHHCLSALHSTICALQKCSHINGAWLRHGREAQ